MKLNLLRKTFSGLLGLVITIIFSTTLYGQYGPSLVENGGLEQGVDVFWEFNTYGGGVGSGAETTDAAEGSKAVEVTVTTVPTMGKVRYRSPQLAVGLHADTAYVFRLKAKSPEELSMKISIKMVGTSGSKNKSSVIYKLSTSYEEYTFILYPGEGYNDEFQAIIQTGNVDEVGKVYLDDLSFKKYNGTNLINNDFEEGINYGWELQVKTDENAAATFSEETTSVPSGAIALKADISATSSLGGFGGVNALSARKLIAADKYLLGCYFKGGAAGDSVSFGPQTWDAAAGFLSNNFYSTAISTDWQWYYAVYNKEATAKWLAMKALLAAKVGTIYVDNLTMGEITSGNITSTATLDATALEAYSYQVTSDITGATYEYTSDIGTRWLNMDPATGILSGTPPAAGVYEITVMAATETFEYAEQVYTLTVAEAAGLAINSTPVETADVDVAYSYQTTVINATGTPVYGIATDVTADWLTIDQTGLLSGTPTVAETIHVTITVTDDNGSQTQEYDLVVAAAAVEITSTAVEVASTGTLYEYQLSFNGTGTFSVATDVTADWLTIDQAGLLSGTPTEDATIHVTVTLEGASNTVTQEFDLVVTTEVGVEAFSIHNVRMYPNPTSSTLYLENLPESAKLDVYDITGKIVKTVFPEYQSAELEVSGLSKGIYILKISGENESLTKRLLIN